MKAVFIFAKGRVMETAVIVPTKWARVPIFMKGGIVQIGFSLKSASDDDGAIYVEDE